MMFALIDLNGTRDADNIGIVSRIVRLIVTLLRYCLKLFYNKMCTNINIL